jgi:hypothetical protein
MKSLLLLLALALALPGFAQERKPQPLNLPAGTKESDRLMQEYMARRAEWLELRRVALEDAKKAKNENEKKNILKKLADDEKALKAATKELAKQLHDAEKARQAEQAAANRN